MLTAATGNNLRGASLRIPLRSFTCVTGVSGSGKSSLILQTLVPAVARALGETGANTLPFESLNGVEQLRRILFVDQMPLGRTSRGNPATYLGIWDALRKRFAQTLIAKERDYKAGMFSANVAGGRCEACRSRREDECDAQ